VFPYRLQVSQQLARVILVSERIDHRNATGPCHRVDPELVERTPDDGGALPVEHARRVSDRFASAELRGLRVDNQRIAAEFRDTDAERHPRPGRRLVKDDGDGLRTVEWTAQESIRLHSVGKVEHFDELSGRQIVVTQEMPHHSCLPADGVQQPRQRSEE
jgi:hypothetical protein